MLLPKRVKYRKQMRGRMTGKASRGTVVNYGDYGLQALEPAWITSRQIEAARVAMTRHTKPRKMGDEGGIIQKEGAIYGCKVMRVCPKCEKPTRPAHKLLADGKKVRVCKKCGAEI